MTQIASTSAKCLFCGNPLDSAHQFICNSCVNRYKQDHSQEFAEARLRYHLSQVNTKHCIVCGDDMGAAKGCVCPWCMERIVEAEVDGSV